MSNQHKCDRDGNSNSSFSMSSVLASLDFKSFQRAVWLWLGASGYRNLRTLARGSRRGRGSIGPDFLIQVGEDGIDVAVQIRHWRSPLTKRAVDELRGILLRDQIPAGMIVCPSQISRAARIAASDFSGRPIRVVGMESLADSMEALGLSTSAFFRSIRAMSLGMPAKQRIRRRTTQPSDFDSPPESEPDIRIVAVALGALIILFFWLLRRALG